MMPALKKTAVLLLMCATAFAQTNPTTGANAKKTTQRTTRKVAAPAVTAEDVKALRDALAAQQQQIEMLRQEMQRRDQQFQDAQRQVAEAQSAARDAQTKAAAVENSATEQKPAFTQLQSDMADVKTTLTNSATSTQDDQKKVSELASTLGRFRWTGDVRVRYENFLQDGTADRHRPRVRLRLGVEGKLNQDFLAGIAIASGATNDPTSTNSTLGDAFQRKPVSLDRGYITYNPVAHKWLSLTGGKFAYTWTRTNASLDPDINPEGFSEKLSFDIKNPVVKNLTVTGMQLLLNEVNNTKNNFTSTLPSGFPTFSNDSWAVGGSISSKLQIGSFWSMTPSYTILNFRNPDSLVNGFASLVNGGNSLDFSKLATPTAVNTTGFAPNGMTNAICTKTVGTTLLPRFCSQFLYSDIIVANVFKTPMEKMPFNLTGEYLKNLNAASDNSHLYFVEASLGQTKNKNDVQFGYSFTRSEQDAVIASFVESDQRFPTNVLQHRIFGSWKVAPNTTLGYTQWIGRALSTTLANTSAFGFAGGKPYGFSSLTVPGGHEPFLKRGQLDLIYSF
ncbi:MAG TPA: putative porin [Clostridia bacterium]|nr:putative porin [Clostridia bacterium]